MNKLYVGFSKQIELPKRGFLFIDDEVPDVPRARIFDVARHCFNPLKDIDYRKAREIADILYTAYPQGEDTLTVRNGKRVLLKALLEASRLDQIGGERPVNRVGRKQAPTPDDEVSGMIDDVLMSPIISRVLCKPTNFSFNPDSVILARLNRAELGDFDALLLGLFLMAHFKGQVIVPDFGFYGRDVHASLIREGRLIAGVNFLGELAPRLRQSVLLIKDKVAGGATFEDAELLAKYAGKRPDPARQDNPYNDFVKAAMA